MARVLVIRGGAIGDFILTLPAIRLLGNELPDAEVEILGYKHIVSIALSAGFARKSRSIEYGPLSGFFVPNGNLDEELAEYFKSFGAVVSYIFDPDGFFHGNLRKCGVETLVIGKPKVRDDHGIHAVRQLAEPLEQLALFLDDDDCALRLDYSESDRDEAESLLGSLQGASPLIGVHPGSGSPYKNWSLENWRETLYRLHAGFPDSRFVIATGEAEQKNVTRFLEELREARLPFFHADSLPLPLLGAVLGRCALFLGHDSGVSHLAAVSGAPCLLLFGPTPPEVWAPPHRSATVIQHASGMLDAITVEQTVARASDFLRQLA